MADNRIPLDDHDAWLLSLANGEKRAYLDVRLFLIAVGRLHLGNCCQADLTAEEMHRLFPIFAKEMGWPGSLYEIQPDTGRCPAVTLYLRDDVPRKEPCFFMIHPFHEALENPWVLDESPVKEKLLEAARVVCRQWLPSWDWSPP